MYIIIKWPLKSVQRDGAYGLTLYLVSLRRICRCSRRGWIRGHHRQYRRWRRRRGWSRQSSRRRRGHRGRRWMYEPGADAVGCDDIEFLDFNPLARKEQTIATKATKYKVNSFPICSISLETFEGPKFVFYCNVWSGVRNFWSYAYFVPLYIF